MHFIKQQEKNVPMKKSQNKNNIWEKICTVWPFYIWILLIVVLRVSCTVHVKSEIRFCVSRSQPSNVAPIELILHIGQLLCHKPEDLERTTDLSQVTDKLYHITFYTSPWSRFELTTSVAIGTDCIGSCKSNYHTITAMTAPDPSWTWTSLQRNLNTENN
jgi:hypothetical protein